MSRQVLLQSGTQAKVAGCQILAVWVWSKGVLQTFCSRSWGRCAVCVWALSPRRTTPLLRRPGRFQCPQEMCDTWDFQKRPVFQVGRHVELPHSYFAYTSGSMSVKTRTLVCMYQHQLNCDEVGIYNIRACKPFSSTLLRCRLQKPKRFVTFSQYILIIMCVAHRNRQLFGHANAHFFQWLYSINWCRREKPLFLSELSQPLHVLISDVIR
jgi:hypothetical protein